MGKTFKTPGVFIEEVPAFSSSVAQVLTSIPVFIGYTERAENGINKPIKITSYGDYISLFGDAFKSKFDILKPNEDETRPLVSLNGEDYVIDYKENNKAFMNPCIKLFYENGGGACYIVSVGTYQDKDHVKIDLDELLGTHTEGGLKTLRNQPEPTIIVIPDAVNLENDSFKLYKSVLKQCAEIQSRFTIVDIYNGYKNRIDSEIDIITNFREKIGTENLSYGAVYYPWLQAIVVQKTTITFQNINLQLTEIVHLLPEASAKTVITTYLESEDFSQENNANLHASLIINSPTYNTIIDSMHLLLNRLPPSAAMAGIYTRVDNDRGVWNAPANVNVSSVLKPVVHITSDEQQDLNVSFDGKSINAIRAFPGNGILVWGARTLDGNSNDWRYINVRRTIIMIEQSIKLALKAYAFEPNNLNTWNSVKSMINNYLTIMWRNGALAGTKPEDAFSVIIGLGNTMTSTDILEGRMLVTVMLAIVRPAEFILVRFEQKTQEA
ncbi:hypothetical protein LPB136_03620 [Tenacibaculum todarodis]|uniref:Phage tail protein n=1 Tax=Tenacibaculum todarodis TaxID=1850252 RepID=A0A1L3JHB2_9FLAO|nr:phage tail sheath C-terminal domain-containing protein [Tenacibaculum todarodis]APG64507.1 hypothetical protein LPB136_03620 [Tenacibaculum todarodis]